MSGHTGQAQQPAGHQEAGLSKAPHGALSLCQRTFPSVTMKQPSQWPHWRPWMIPFCFPCSFSPNSTDPLKWARVSYVISPNSGRTLVSKILRRFSTIWILTSHNSQGTRHISHIFSDLQMQPKDTITVGLTALIVPGALGSLRAGREPPRRSRTKAASVCPTLWEGSELRDRPPSRCWVKQAARSPLSEKAGPSPPLSCESVEMLLPCILPRSAPRSLRCPPDCLPPLWGGSSQAAGTVLLHPRLLGTQ